LTTIRFGELEAVAPATRRTLALRILLGLGAVVLAAAAVVLGRGESAPPGLLPAGTDGLVVLDVSASISSDTYARIMATLDRLADSDRRYGLILFSDTAYLALPPGAPAAELEPFARQFDLRPHRTGALVAPTNPWTGSFSAGTKISSGLQLALDTIRERRLGHPDVLLVSDLDDDAGDLESLTSVALAYRRLGVPIRVVGLNPSPEDVRLVERLLPQGGSVMQSTLPGERNSADREGLPGGLVAAAIALSLVLALFLVVTERLRWSRA
jgi:hypothetical protein